MIEEKHNIDFIEIECTEHIWSQKWCKNINQIQCWHDKQTDKIENDDNEIETAVTKSSNECKWIYVTNKFTVNNKMYNKQ